MLCLAFAPGEYMMIGDSVVVQMEKITGDRCRLAVHAPKDIPIVRGTVLERTGGERPECVLDAPRWHRKEIVWNRSKAQALAAMRALLSEMDSEDANVRTLRRQLNHIFPLEPKAEQANQISNG